MSDIASALLRLLPPETAHDTALALLRAAPGWALPARRADPPVLATEVAGLALSNPVGLAAGFDKTIAAPDKLWRFGFGFLEVGAITPRPQPGNPKPRLFRLTREAAIINRFGFNNEGLDAAAARLQARRGGPALVGVNLGANKDADDRAADYVAGLTRLHGLADFFVVNVSSPNTPGLRGLQEAGALEDLLARLGEARAALAGGRPAAPVFVKVAPDLAEADIETMASAFLASGAVDALIVSNTTLARPEGLASPLASEQGGLSGRPLFGPSTEILKRFRLALGGRLALIGVGGVEDGATAYAKIRAGASAVQLYTALIYQGTGVVERIKADLARRLAADGFSSVAEAVGVDAPI